VRIRSDDEIHRMAKLHLVCIEAAKVADLERTERHGTILRLEGWIEGKLGFANHESSLRKRVPVTAARQTIFTLPLRFNVH
jgi:hypothetical protein